MSDVSSPRESMATSRTGPSPISEPPAGGADRYVLSQLQALEAEAIHIIREVAAEFEHPVLLFSGGKDSIVMLHLAAKAFYPAALPFPIMHVDTGRNFPEVLDIRDRRARRGRGPPHRGLGPRRHRRRPGGRGDGRRGQPQPAADDHPAAVDPRGWLRRCVRRGPTRRGESSGQGADLQLPRRVRPVGSQASAARVVEPVQRSAPRGEHIRVFPLSNWTELDVWQYIADEGIEVPSIYFAHRRPVVLPRRHAHGGQRAPAPRARTRRSQEALVRFRTVGDADCTGCVESAASTIDQIIEEVAVTRLTERGATRADDRISEAGMEDRKREGYF